MCVCVHFLFICVLCVFGSVCVYVRGGETQNSVLPVECILISAAECTRYELVFSLSNHVTFIDHRQAEENICLISMG